MSGLLERLEAAAVALLEEHNTQAAQWQGLHLALGRATQAAATGNTDELHRWLDAAGDLEYDLIGSAEILGRILDDLEPAPHEEES